MLHTSAKRRRPINQNEATAIVAVGLVATVLATIGPELATAQSWADVAQPAFVGRALAQIGGALAAVYGAKKLRP